MTALTVVLSQMTWAEWLIVSVMLHYFAAAAIYAWQRDPWTAWTYTAYALANVGLIKMAMNARGL